MQSTVSLTPSRQKPGQYICCQNHKLIADIEDDIMDPDTFPFILSFTHCGNKVILRVLRIILVILPEHPSDTKEHLKMEMEIPCSNKIKFITACSFSNDSFEDIMKAQVSVIKASATLNIQAFKIKKSVSISFRMTQVHKMAKDHMMMIRDYDWMMISKKLKDHIQVKLKPKSLKFTTSDSQDTNQ
ncbi:hypothetical protein Tco_0920179 [Tanacetum coccineum]